MVVRIRLARLSRAHEPLYNIVVAQARSARDSKPMEVLGTYDPTPRTPLANHDTPEKVIDEVTGLEVPYVARRYKDIKLDTVRTKYWLGVGARPTEGVEKLFMMMGLIEPKPSQSQLDKMRRERGPA